MADYDPKMIEALRDRLFGSPTFGTDTNVEAARVQIALSALPLTPEALNAIWRGEAVVVNETTGLPYLDADRQPLPAPPGE